MVVAAGSVDCAGFAVADALAASELVLVLLPQAASSKTMRIAVHSNELYFFKVDMMNPFLFNNDNHYH
ncbi:hypothetical protein D3C87_2168290 [compost metagenome]